MAFVVFNLLAAAALIGIDQAIKLWATNVLQPVGAMPLIPHVVELRFVLNPGMAFSLLSGKQLFLIIATSAALLAVAYGLFFRSRGKRLQQAALVLVLGGGMTYTFAAAEGGKVGNSICEPDQFQTALDILAKAKEKGVKVVMSPDALIADAFSADANTNVAPANNIPDGWEGVDIADEGKKVFREEILKCKTILWNGPVGVFEIDKFATGSRAVAEAIAEATSKGAYSLIGGGDSVACINKFGLADKVSYVSTGGGALLEYMEGKELPGVAAIRK